MLVSAYAKLNLSLNITALPSHEGGLHKLDSIFQTVSLSDTIAIETVSEKGLFLNTGGDRGICLSNKNNLITHIFKKYEAKIPLGISVRLEKNIPMGAGLGGGSSNAATFLRFLQNRFALFSTERDLCEAAKYFGSDIPFFLVGGRSHVGGVGDKLTVLHKKKKQYYLLLLPNIVLSTKDVYAKYRQLNAQNSFSNSDVFQNKNDLTEAAYSLSPPLHALVEKVECLTGKVFQMTGSGASFFMSCSSFNESKCIQKTILKELPEIVCKSIESIDNTYAMQKR